MSRWGSVDEVQCRHLIATVEMIGRRWASGVLMALGGGDTRFNEIRRAVPGVSARMLAVRLAELERAELLERVVAPTTPVEVHYGLTKRGRELLAALAPLADYAHKWDAAQP